MKKSVIRYLGIAVPALFITAAQAGEKFYVLTSKGEVPYNAQIKIAKGAGWREGNKTVSYDMTLDSAHCHTHMTGHAKFYSKLDSVGSDSSILPDGRYVLSNVFRDVGANGVVEITMDVQSRTPQYVGVGIQNAPLTPGSCITEKDDGWNFFRW
ncbi:hypothetical protein [Caballeronia sp. GAFFF1]|uniref:hypothetical protein n=1 Tax=Caballeronia sp. GAFFF1 TaxID=2921779 RepID=UPI0020289F52|nr:hypothetical protein [Caballeronia sp. GAFFF1]